MAIAKAKNLDQSALQRKAMKERVALEIAAIKKRAAAEDAMIRGNERRLRSVDIRDRRKRDNHAKILLGVAAIHLHKNSAEFRALFNVTLSEFYTDAPLKREAALQGLKIIVMKPASDTEKN